MLSQNQLWGTIIQICADRGVVYNMADIHTILGNGDPKQE